MTEALHELSIAEAGALLRDGSLTSVALTRHTLDRIAERDPAIRAFITITPERALADAAAADAAIARGEDLGPLHGIPYGLKDIFDTAGIRTTCHSKLLVDHVPDTDAYCQTLLRRGGGVLVGKLATHEFAMGGPSFDLPFPPARNPWNVAHTPGGSSSGSAAAVAAGLLRTAMGSDTGGSIRLPAGYCGVVGLKPTYGLVSRRGVYPLSYTLDHAGPLARTVEDCALTLAVVAGHDADDPASAAGAAANFTRDLKRGVEGLRIGFVRHFHADAGEAAAETVAALEAAADRLARLGAVVEEVRLPDYALFNAASRIIISAECFAVHEKNLRERPLDYGRLGHERLVLGAFVSGADYVQAMRVRRELAIVLNLEVLARFDALILASTLTPAPRFADISSTAPTVWPIRMSPFNLTGNPALSVPNGLSSSGLPLSMQIVGRPFDDATVLRVGHAHETSLAD
ncbi:MAG: amidase [Rhizobiaceae bacterium]|nr:amidase [Rhizobiaceae bacterium]